MAEKKDDRLAGFRAALVIQRSKASGNQPPQAKAADAVEPHKAPPEGARGVEAKAPAQVAPPAAAPKAAPPAVKPAAPTAGCVSVGSHISPSNSLFVVSELRDGSLGPEIIVHGEFYSDRKLVALKIGKLPTSHIIVDDVTVSRMHAVVELSEKGYELIDLGSTRGTCINGEKIAKWSFKEGDVLKFGDVELKVTRIKYDPAPLTPESEHAPAPVQSSAVPTARAAQVSHKTAIGRAPVFPLKEPAAPPAAAVQPPKDAPFVAPLARPSAAHLIATRFSIQLAQIGPDGSTLAEFKFEKVPFVRIGKLEDCVLGLEDETVSRRHATIGLVNGHCQIFDNGSSNGTFVDKGEGEKKITGPALEGLLEEGNTIRVGAVRFRVQRLTYSAGEPVREAAPTHPQPVAPVRPPATGVQLPPPIRQARPAPAKQPPVVPPAIAGTRVPPAPAGPVQPPTAAPTSAPTQAKRTGLTHLPKKRTIAVVALAGFAACAALIGLHHHNERKAAEARAAERQARITQMADKIKSCRPGPLPKGCLSDADKREVRTVAEQYEKLGDSAADQGKKLGYYTTAVRARFRLGEWDKARDIIAKDLRQYSKNGEGTPAPADADPAEQLSAEMSTLLDAQIADPGRCARTVPKGCPSGVEMEALRMSAKNSEAGGDYRKAGLTYVEIGDTESAKRMIERCKQSDKLRDGTVVDRDTGGAAEITDRFNMMAEALRLSVSK